MEEFAGQRLADGRLKFGLQFWNDRGHFLGLFGIALPDGAGWRYVDRTEASGCEFRVERSEAGVLMLAVKPGATCQDRGGYGTELDSVVFPPSAYTGAVTSELHSQGVFFERKTGCGS